MCSSAIVAAIISLAVDDSVLDSENVVATFVGCLQRDSYPISIINFEDNDIECVSFILRNGQAIVLLNGRQ